MGSGRPGNVWVVVFEVGGVKVVRWTGRQSSGGQGHDGIKANRPSPSSLGSSKRIRSAREIDQAN